MPRISAQALINFWDSRVGAHSRVGAYSRVGAHSRVGAYFKGQFPQKV